MIAAMKKSKYMICLLLAFAAAGQYGCKEFLDVKPVDKLTGNNFWKSRQDVESYIWDIHGLFRAKIGSTPFLPASGDIRCGMMAETPQMGNGRDYFDRLAANDLMYACYPTGGEWWQATFHFEYITRWKEFYQVIQACNILDYELDNREVPDLSEADIKRFKAEGAFMRSLSYFFIVRLFGDVPYYREAYQQDPLPRTDMITVLNNCIEDLMAVKNDLPWTFEDPAYQGVRVSRGSALALLMHMNMWNAGFDQGNKQHYYRQTADLGKELVESDAYELMPIEDFHLLFKGRTREGLYEIAQNFNYGELVGYNTFADMVLHYPYKRPAISHQYSYSYFRSDFLQRLYPPSQADERTEVWFDSGMFSDDGTFQFLKFTNVYAIEDGEDVNPDGNIIIFRYAGAILLRAEALAELGEENEAIRMMNLVRQRAGASNYNGSGGQALKDEIFAERARELMGEGHYFYDLVRTRRVLDSRWSFYPLTEDQFNRGGWTWPLDPAVQNNNPLMTLNTYWLGGGQ